MSTKYSLMTQVQKQKANERNRRWKEKNRDKVLEYKRTHYKNNKEKYLTIERDRQYKVRYGISIEDYNRMLEEQSGKCKICSSEKGGNKNQCFAVDHCHTTGRVRGLLCIKCNARLGWFELNLKEVINYLK